jgi:hypothetical protein
MYLCVRGINVPIQGSERSCICVLEVSILSFSTILIFNFGINTTRSSDIITFIKICNKYCEFTHI